jgi:cell division septum initiation protein DivIVA
MDDIEELKALIVHKMDVLEFLDMIEMDFSELVDLLEEQIEEHESRLHRACL